MSKLLRLLSLALAISCVCGCAGPRNLPPRVDHIRLEVSNMQASVAFYRDMLGLRVRSESADFSWLEAGNMGVALSAKPWGWVTPRARDERAGWGMYPHFEVDDVEALAAKIQAAGFKVVQKPEKHSFGTEAFVADPDGYVWALFSWR